MRVILFQNARVSCVERSAFRKVAALEAVINITYRLGGGWGGGGGGIGENNGRINY